MSCNESERAKIGRVHDVINSIDGDPGTSSIGDGDIVAQFEFDACSIENNGTGIIEGFQLFQYAASSVTLNETNFRLVFTNTDIGVANESPIDFSSFSDDYSLLIGVHEIVAADFVTLETGTLTTVTKNDLNLNYKTASDNKQLFAYLVADGSYTIPGTSDFQLNIKVTKD